VADTTYINTRFMALEKTLKGFVFAKLRPTFTLPRWFHVLNVKPPMIGSQGHGDIVANQSRLPLGLG